MLVDKKRLVGHLSKTKSVTFYPLAGTRDIGSFQETDVPICIKQAVRRAHHMLLRKDRWSEEDYVFDDEKDQDDAFDGEIPTFHSDQEDDSDSEHEERDRIHPSPYKSKEGFIRAVHSVGI